MRSIDGARPLNDDCDWVRAHTALSRLARERATADAEEGRWLLRALRSSAHVHVGCGSFSEYIERLFGYKPRSTQEKLRVAESLEDLPQIAAALEAGTLSWCAARELTRLAVADTERAWLDAAQGKTIRQLEELVANRSPGDTPATPPRNLPRLRVLRFEVTPETFALFRQALQHLRRSADAGWDDDAALLTMSRHVLVGPADAGRSSYQVSLSICSACGAGEQLAGGERVQVDDAVVAMAQCDAQLLGPLLPRAANQNARDDARLEVVAEPRVPCFSEPLQGGTAVAQQSGDGNEAAPRNLDAHVDGSSKLNGDGIDTAGRNPDAVNASARPVGQASKRSDGEVGSAPVHPPQPRRNASDCVQPTPRAKQNMPPALRRAVLARDQHRCRVPGCMHSTFIDVHHIVPRSEGGRQDPANLITLCGAHHRAAHRGELRTDLQNDGTVIFRHADGAAYGRDVNARVVDAQGRVYSGLRNLGFRERDIKPVLVELLANAELRDATPERLLREALRRIRITRH
jgi:HNH endonuclease